MPPTLPTNSRIHATHTIHAPCYPRQPRYLGDLFGYNAIMKQGEHWQRNTSFVSKMIISARRILSSVLPKELLVKFSR